MKKAPLFRLVIAVSLSLLVASCHEKAANSNNAVAPDVNIVVAAQQNIPINTEYVGQVFGQEDVQIQSRTQGWVTGMFFKEGQKVEKGSLLYTIDDLPIRTQIDGYKANLAKALTMMTDKKSTLARVQPLAQMKALSAQDLDAATAAYEAAQSEVAISRSQLADMQIQLSYTRIKAPISGVIGISNVQVGDFVGGPTVGPLNTISSTSTIKVRFSISENDYLKYIERVNADTAYLRQLSTLPVDLILGDGSIYPEKGNLMLTNRQIDPATGSLIVEAGFPNNQLILKPGQYVKVKFRINELINAVVVPQQAVNQMQNIYQVYVLNDSNKVVPRIVVPGQRIGSNWVISQGLKAGEKLAILGSTFINPELPVKPTIVNWNLDSTKTN